MMSATRRSSRRRFTGLSRRHSTTSSSTRAPAVSASWSRSRRLRGRDRREDDGRGIGDGGGGDGFGLLGMRERIALVGGTLVITDAEGGGTRVSASLPVPGS